MRRLTREPVTAAVLAPIIVWLGAYFGLDVDETTASQLAGAALVVAGLVARQSVTPESDPRDRKGRPLVPAREARPERPPRDVP
jgi:hypothetical protein